jgi:hypothetical protein
MDWKYCLGGGGLHERISCQKIGMELDEGYPQLNNSLKGLLKLYWEFELHS